MSDDGGQQEVCASNETVRVVPFQLKLAELFQLTVLVSILCGIGQWVGWEYVLTALLNPFSVFIYYAFYIERTRIREASR